MIPSTCIYSYFDNIILSFRENRFIQFVDVIHPFRKERDINN